MSNFNSVPAKCAIVVHGIINALGISGYIVNAAQTQVNKSGDSIVVHGEDIGAEQMPLYSGNYPITVRIVIRSQVDDTVAVSNHHAAFGQIVDELTKTTVLTAMNDGAYETDFHAFNVSHEGGGQLPVDGREWVSEIIFQIVCCGQAIGA